MQHIYSEDQLRLAARLYYLDGLAQNEVARLVNVSQPKVSRLLALARQRGIVRITVSNCEERRTELEQQLCQTFGLATAIVPKLADGLGAADLRRAVGHLGARAVDELIAAGATVALAGGRTLHELAKSLPESSDKAITVVQAMGSVDSNVSEFDAQEIGRALAQRCGGTFLALNTPAFIPERRTRDVLLALTQVRKVRQQWDDSSAAIVGLGTLQNSVFAERGTLTPASIRELEKAGAVGEICGRFFDAHGDECATSWRDRVISIRIEQLRKIPQVIAVVSGSDRSEAILAAIEGGIIKSLVIDETGALTLLATKRSAPSRSLKTKFSQK
ncbi:MAG TPA: sugar-binding domain-containing protein [Opitutaceae bacterium]